MDISKIKSGDHLGVSSGSWLAEQIQDFQRCKWNHSGVFVWIEGVLYVSEALEHGVTLTSFDTYLKGDSQLLVQTLGTANQIIDIDSFKHYILDHGVGDIPYDKFNLVFHQAVKYITKYSFRFLRSIGFDIKKKYIWIGKKSGKAKKKMVCGEWSAYLYNRFIPTWHKTWWDDAPEDVVKNGKFYKNYVVDKKKRKLVEIKGI